MRLCFVAGRNGNYHMTELLRGLCVAARAAGIDAELADGSFPELESQIVYVVIPHEFFGCEPTAEWPSAAQRARTLALFVENPFTPWFERAADLAPYFPRVLAINRTSIPALRERGVQAEHIQLGYVATWDEWHGECSQRTVDVTYLGAADPRRDSLLAEFSRWLWPQRTALLVPRIEPKPGPRPDYLVETEKFEHLARSKLIVNLHRAGTTSFEWVRVLQAIANGCVVVSEPSTDSGPLVAGEHFVAAAAEGLPHVIEHLLADPERTAAIRDRAYAFVREHLPMEAGAQQLGAAGEALLGRRRSKVPAIGPEPPAPSPAHDPAAQPDGPPRIGAAVRHLTTEVMELRRAIDRLAARGAGLEPDGPPILTCETPAFRDARPRVTVGITLFNYEREVVAALDSVARSEFTELEVLILDDASKDQSVPGVRRFASDHPWLPLRLLRHPVNRGLGAGRNALAHAARGEFLFVLDADNEIYPTTLERLVDALDADPGASFAYPLLAVTSGGRVIDLLSRDPWDPALFRTGNYIDAMALLRIDDLLALGGYTEDPRLTGWEDFHLWCRLAEAGQRGHHVPEVLGRYRRSAHSMLGWTQTDATAAWSVMRARFPALLEPVPA